MNDKYMKMMDPDTGAPRIVHTPRYVAGLEQEIRGLQEDVDFWTNEATHKVEERDEARKTAQIWQEAAAKFAKERDGERAAVKQMERLFRAANASAAQAWGEVLRARHWALAWKRAAKRHREGRHVCGRIAAKEIAASVRMQEKLEAAQIRAGICPACENDECMADGVNLWCPACDASYTLEEKE